MRLLVDEPLAEVARVKLLEDVLVVEVLEHRDGVGQLVVDLGLRDALLRLLQQAVAVPGQKLRGLEYQVGKSVQFTLG